MATTSIEINNLNHYIGMKKIEQADFIEMQIMPFMFGVFILLALRSVVFGEMKEVIDLFVLACLFRRLLDRLVLLSALSVWAQSRSARAGPYPAVHAARFWHAENREFHSVELSRSWERICSGFSWCCSFSRSGFRARRKCSRREAGCKTPGSATRLAGAAPRRTNLVSAHRGKKFAMVGTPSPAARRARSRIMALALCA